MKIKVFLIILLFGFFTISCEKFLEEEIISGAGYSYYNTEDGISAALNSAYPYLKQLWGHYRGMNLLQLGTDEMTNGYGGDRVFNYYTSEVNPSHGYINDLWTNMYKAIDICNNIIEKISDVEFQSSSIKDIKAGEAYFLRAVYYFVLVRQFGSVPLKIEATTTPERDFKRAPIADIYKQIISDLRAADSKLPPAQSEYGRATKGAADHLLALVYLTRTSADTDVRGSKPTDVDSVIYYSEAVIKSGLYELEPEFSTFFQYYDENGNDDPNCKEMVFTVQNTKDVLLRGAGNTWHCYYLTEYDMKPGMLLDLENGRSWVRLYPTDFANDCYDRKIDSRYYKQMKMAFYCNNPKTIPKWPDGTPKFELGDTAVYMSLDRDVPLSEVESKPYLWVPHSIVKDDGSGYIREHYDERNFPTLRKFLDRHREGRFIMQGGRDFPVHRFAETLLIAAEGYGLKKDYAKAVEYINMIRYRAAYKEGEEKPPQYLSVENGDPAKITASTVNDMMINVDQINSRDKLVNFILDERLRELCGEGHRWFDLVRTGTLYERTKLHNYKAVGIQPYHKLRPIPQHVHLDRLENPGPLSEEQNPGYY
jgi:starch-binding outer membrane protein, SusD/RagB family